MQHSSKRLMEEYLRFCICIFFYEPNGSSFFTVQQAAAEKKPSVAAFKRRLRHTQLLLLHSFATKRSRKEGSIKSVSVYEILTYLGT